MGDDETAESETDEPIGDYLYFYTNRHPEEVPAEALRRDSRRRWIETGFRVIEGEFPAEPASRNPALRVFYFNSAVHSFNSWTVANILRAAETRETGSVETLNG